MQHNGLKSSGTEFGGLYTWTLHLLLAAMKCHHQIYAGALIFFQPYRSEHTLAGRFPGIGDRKLHWTGKMALLIKVGFQCRSWLSNIGLGKVVFGLY